MEVSISSLISYLIGQLLFTALAYAKHQTIENYLLCIALVTACSVLLTPLKSVGITGCDLTTIAFTLFTSSYYNYEPAYKGKQNT